jgi:proline iminopeptidase
MKKLFMVLPLVFLLCLTFSCQKGEEVLSLTAGEGYIDVTGGRVWYKIVGSGTATPLLLLHGGPGVSSDSLEPLAKLSDDRPVIFYDQLGSGKSDRPSDVSLWYAQRFVEELSLVRDALRLKKVHIFGHSWGTMLAVDYMLTKPSGVKSLILASPCISIPRWIQDANRLRAALPIETQDILKKHEEAGTTDSEEYMAATMEFYSRHLCRLDPWPPILQKVFADFNTEVYGTMWGPSEFHATGNLKDYNRTEQLKEISIPTLFTAGRYDEATPETTAFYKSFIPGASLKIFENSSHMAMHEETELYIKAIREFLIDTEND